MVIYMNNENKGRMTLKRIAALICIIIILGLYILSFVAALSDWENRFAIFMATAACTIVFPIIIYIISLLARMKAADSKSEKHTRSEANTKSEKKAKAESDNENGQK